MHIFSPESVAKSESKVGDAREVAEHIAQARMFTSREI